MLSGGGYDRLIAEFGEDLPAVGFGVQTDLLARAKLRRGETASPPTPAALVFGDNGFETNALDLQARLLNEGVLCENSLAPTQEAAVEYARQCGIPTVYILDETGVREVRV